MFIPLHQNSIMQVYLKELDITLLVRPVTGENEEFLLKAIVGDNAKTKEDQKTSDSTVTADEKNFAEMNAFSKAVFNKFVVGYVLSDESKTEYLFKETEKAFEFFNQKAVSWLTENIWEINTLSTEQKKS